MSGVHPHKQAGIDRRNEIVDVIDAYTREHDASPTRAEIAQRMGLTPQAIEHHVKILIAEGVLAGDRHHRSLRIIAP